MTAAATPGPWAATRSNPAEGADVWWITNADAGNFEKEIASVPGGAPSSEANAKLIASAPDLKNGCNALLGLLQLICARDDVPAAIRHILMDNHRVDEARAAIAKAEGVEPDGGHKLDLAGIEEA